MGGVGQVASGGMRERRRRLLFKDGAPGVFEHSSGGCRDFARRDLSVGGHEGIEQLAGGHVELTVSAADGNLEECAQDGVWGDLETTGEQLVHALEHVVVQDGDVMRLGDFGMHVEQVDQRGHVRGAIVSQELAMEGVVRLVGGGGMMDTRSEFAWDGPVDEVARDLVLVLVEGLSGWLAQVFLLVDQV